MSRDRWDPLRKELDGLASRAEHGLRGVRTRVRLARELRAQATLPALTLLTVAGLMMLARAAGVDWLRLGFLELLGVALLPYLAVVAYRTWGRDRETISRSSAIGEWDRQLHLADRLAAADEFLGVASRSRFMEAAVDDASAHLTKTRDAQLQFGRPHVGRRGLAGPTCTALALLFGCLWIADWRAPVLEIGEDVVVEVPPGGLTQEVIPDGDVPTHEPEVEPEGREGETRPPERNTTGEMHAADTSTEEESKESQGATGSGRSSEAESSSGAGSAQGSPSKQGQISKPGEKKTTAAKKPTKKKEPPKNDDKAKKNDEQESGSTAGRGSSRGSNRNPAASDWASKDHVNTPDDQDLDEEDEIDDEDEEQESRGGMQPSLRDRKPPVSRDLSIGFGNRPNPDAKGRGGPSQPKKSRGTASLVLGVPIPDRVKGQPNPGKTKITQERVQPRAEPADQAVAGARNARDVPASALRRQELEPWMRAVVRDWFLRMRKQENTET